MCSGWVVGGCVTRAQGWAGGGFCTWWRKQNWLVLTISLVTFWEIQLDIWGFLSRMAFCEPGRVNRVSSAEFWLIFRRSALDIWANSLEGGLWGFGLSTGTARAQAIVAAQNAGGLPSRLAFPSCPGTVLTVGGWLWVVCQNHRAGWLFFLRLWLQLEYVVALSGFDTVGCLGEFFPG